MDFETHYPQSGPQPPTQQGGQPQQQQGRQQQQQPPPWAPHLLPSHHSHGQSAFPSPVTPPTSLSDVHPQQQSQYPPHATYFHPHAPSGGPPPGQGDSRGSLSLNLSSLSVASPTNLSPINPSPLHTHNLHHGPLGGGSSSGGGGHGHSHSTSTVSSTMSPVTPISPSNSGGGPGGLQYGHHPTGSMQHAHAFQFNIPPPGPEGPGGFQNDYRNSLGTAAAATTTASSRSSSSSEIEKSVPRKRSFSANPTTQNGIGIVTPTSVNASLGGAGGGAGGGGVPGDDLTMFNDISHSPHSSRRTVRGPHITMDVTYEDMDISTSSSTPGGAHGYTLLDGSGNASPIDGGAGSGGSGGGDEDDEDGEGERDDQLKPLEGVGLGGSSSGGGLDVGGAGGSMGILGKPMGTNNFVTKLYQMINDPTSSRFISWTELGTSFVVSNVGEFSRSILGSHFKHNNFSSFVRQLNMYGFHKINRTPRSQRTSTDAQTWEFSHHKFLRGRPDLLDEIKRKALEPDPGVKHRVELPGEMILMREENKRVWDALMQERKKVERLVGVVKGLWDVVGKGFPGSIPPFPTDLLEVGDNPNIYITSPTNTSQPRSFPPPLSTSLSTQSLHSLHSMGSPGSSPTTGEFPSHMHPHPQPPPLSRQHSFQQMGFPGSSASSTPLPSSPGSVSMDLFEGDVNDGRGSSKRQRTSNENLSNGASGSEDASSTGTLSGGGTGKRGSRARSDSAPLGYGNHNGLNTGLSAGGWQQSTTGIVNRPRSGSGLAGRGMGMGMPGVRTANGTGGGSGHSTPLHSLPNLTNNSPGR